jgi:hypothetical protein
LKAFFLVSTSNGKAKSATRHDASTSHCGQFHQQFISGFAPMFLHQKEFKSKIKCKKVLRKNFSTKNGARKMLVKLAASAALNLNVKKLFFHLQ